ncbi:MAG: hypothetical protein ACK56F_31845 [bacterium]
MLEYLNAFSGLVTDIQNQIITSQLQLDYETEAQSQLSLKKALKLIQDRATAI